MAERLSSFSARSFIAMETSHSGENLLIRFIKGMMQAPHITRRVPAFSPFGDPYTMERESSLKRWPGEMNEGR